MTWSVANISTFAPFLNIVTNLWGSLISFSLNFAPYIFWFAFIIRLSNFILDKLTWHGIFSLFVKPDWVTGEDKSVFWIFKHSSMVNDYKSEINEQKNSYKRFKDEQKARKYYQEQEERYRDVSILDFDPERDAKYVKPLS